jgi:hypothetical protein
MDNRGHFHRKKIVRLAWISFNAQSDPSGSRSVWPKGHMAEQSVAVRRGYLPKRHVFRREFQQSDGQLMLTHANDAKDVIPAILF